jgi:hypothetical protein
MFCQVVFISDQSIENKRDRSVTRAVKSIFSKSIQLDWLAPTLENRDFVTLLVTLILQSSFILMQAILKEGID